MREVVGLDVEAVAVETDVFGTFTGEVDRIGTAVDSAIAKARLGMSVTGCPIGIASEGSIGLGRYAPLISDEEWLVIVDDERGFVLAESVESVEIVARTWIVDDTTISPGALREAGFPQHGLIVRPESMHQPVFKGIHDVAALHRAVDTCRRASTQRVRIETDLRASHCPTRRLIIEKAARRLAARLGTPCPVCNCPGWGPVDVERGLPCRACERPTRGVRARVNGCPRCDHRESEASQDLDADPATCDFCNP